MAGYVFVYWRNNSSYQLNDPSNGRYLLGMRGFGAPNIHYPTMRAPYTDGEVLLGTPAAWPPNYTYFQPVPQPYTSMREMEIAIGLSAASASAFQTAYAELLAALSPHRQLSSTYPSYLKITLPDTATYRAIGCFCSSVSDPEMDGPAYGRVVITFFAWQPYFVLPTGADTYTAWATGTNPKTITNSGDAPMWSPQIIVYGAAATTIVNPHITNNTTGKIWSTSQTIAVGTTKYVVAYMDRAQMGYYDGATTTDIISKLDTDAEFWPLQAGDNSLQWSSTSGTPSAIRVYHSWLYLGI